MADETNAGRRVRVVRERPFRGPGLGHAPGLVSGRDLAKAARRDGRRRKPDAKLLLTASGQLDGARKKRLFGIEGAPMKTPGRGGQRRKPGVDELVA